LSRAGRLAAAALVGLLIVGVIAAVISRRQIEGAVPGKSPVLSLVRFNGRFVVGTDKGMASSADGRNWERVDSGKAGRALLAVNNGPAPRLFALAGDRLLVTSDLHTFDEVARIAGASAFSAGGTDLYAATREGRLFEVKDSVSNPLPLGAAAPKQVLALWVGLPDVYEGGFSEGLWHSADSGRTWKRLIATPTRAILRKDDGTLLVGTPGGLLVSSGQEWRFTSFHVGIEALAADEPGAAGAATRYIYAAGVDRFIYRSPDGISGWQPVAKKN
jgi:hypothetical protein